MKDRRSAEATGGAKQRDSRAPPRQNRAGRVNHGWRWWWLVVVVVVEGKGEPSQAFAQHSQPGERTSRWRQQLQRRRGAVMGAASHGRPSWAAAEGSWAPQAATNGRAARPPRSDRHGAATPIRTLAAAMPIFARHNSRRAASLRKAAITPAARLPVLV